MRRDRRVFIRTLAGAAAASVTTVGASLEARAARRDQPSRAGNDVEAMFRDSVIVDAQAHPQWWPLLPEFDPMEIDFTMIADSGVTVISETYGPTGNVLDAEQSYREALRRLALVSALVARYPDRMMLIRTAADIANAKKQQKLGMLVNFQDCTPVGTDLNRLDAFYGLGLRQLQVTYSMRNLAGDGCYERTQAGLSYFGVDLVQKLNDLGILVDAAHCGPQTTLDTIETSKKPVILSHACCKAVYDHPRNKTDEAIKAMANKGGVIGISTMTWFVGPANPLTLDHVLDHFEHAIRVAGPDHVGIGTDLGLPGWLVAGEPDRAWEMVRKSYTDRDIGWELAKPHYPPFVQQLNDAKRYLILARGLLKRGYSMSDVRKVLGENFLRVYKEVLQAPARPSQTGHPSQGGR